MHHITVTIVEDNPMITIVLKRILTSNGYYINQTFSSAEDILKSIDTISADIIISDLELSPFLNGYCAAVQMRELLNTPILFYSDCGDRDLILSCLIMKGSKFVAKSSPVENLLSALEEIVSENPKYYREAI